jgi:hypothetical protein
MTFSAETVKTLKTSEILTLLIEHDDLIDQLAEDGEELDDLDKTTLVARAQFATMMLLDELDRRMPIPS